MAIRIDPINIARQLPEKPFLETARGVSAARWKYETDTDGNGLGMRCGAVINGVLNQNFSSSGLSDSTVRASYGIEGAVVGLEEIYLSLEQSEFGTDKGFEKCKKMAQALQSRAGINAASGATIATTHGLLIAQELGGVVSKELSLTIKFFTGLGFFLQLLFHGQGVQRRGFLFYDAWQLKKGFSKADDKRQFFQTELACSEKEIKDNFWKQIKAEHPREAKLYDSSNDYGALSDLQAAYKHKVDQLAKEWLEPEQYASLIDNEKESFVMERLLQIRLQEKRETLQEVLGASLLSEIDAGNVDEIAIHKQFNSFLLESFSKGFLFALGVTIAVLGAVAFFITTINPLAPLVLGLIFAIGWLKFDGLAMIKSHIEAGGKGNIRFTIKSVIGFLRIICLVAYHLALKVTGIEWIVSLATTIGILIANLACFAYIKHRQQQLAHRQQQLAV